MAQCEKDGHGVGIRGGARSSGGKMTRTAPWQHKGKCAGDLYAARMWVESCHVTAALDVIADVRRTQGWAEAALAEFGFGKTQQWRSFSTWCHRNTSLVNTRAKPNFRLGGATRNDAHAWAGHRKSGRVTNL